MLSWLTVNMLMSCEVTPSQVSLYLDYLYTVVVHWTCLATKLQILVCVGTILFGKYLVTTDGNLSLGFSTIVMRCHSNISMTYANGTFCITVRISLGL